ncbi:cytotoxic T-lymphocyte protein 4-like [Cyclopterus lumpus]|uniref:cytotoxic T-lymphocyte protein 4-like n=1 Tax=Cyclopterus lumpus TaxID=8103 RepID=UPI001486D733|nr:cytotoxic T-lymphocyte protein 4-like [Cyclopterus lumpus]
MLLAHCVMPWVVLTVLSRPAWSAVKVIQPYRVVSANGEAQVKCLVQPRPSHDLTPPYPHPDPEELRVTLLKGLYGAREACSSILTLTGQREPAVEHRGEVQCSAQMTEGAVEVTVTGLRAADTDLYRCDIEIFFPPPYRRLTGNGTLVHVLGGTARTETFLSHSHSSELSRAGGSGTDCTPG